MPTIPIIKVHNVIPWKSWGSIHDAVANADNDFTQTNSLDKVINVLNLNIDCICWDDTSISIAFANGRSLTLSISGREIVLSKKSELRLNGQDKGLASAVYLKFETLVEPILWKRAEVLQSREGAIFKGMQLSGSSAFVYITGQEPLLLSIFEYMDEKNRSQLMLHWADAE